MDNTISDTPTGERTPPVAGRVWVNWTSQIFLILLLAGNGWAQYVLWFGNQGLIRWYQTERQLVATRQKIQSVEQRLRDLREEIRLIENNSLLLEEVARQGLGLVYPDELVFVLPPPLAASAESTP